VAKQSPKTESKSTKKQPNNDILVGVNAWALVFHVGWQAAVPILVLGIGGAFLDKHYHTTPLFLLIGVACAFGLSYVLVRGTVRRMQRHVDDLVRKGVIKP
jgi:F0F1-type ATP synthase assembly protein I